MLQVVQLRRRVPPAEAEKLRGKPLTDDMVPIRLAGDADVYRPDGSLLIKLRKRALTKAASNAAWPHLHWMRDKYMTDNRSSYGGAAETATDAGGKQTRARDASGKVLSVASAAIGYFDRQGGRFRFCRETAFVANEVQRWRKVLPMVAEAAALFEREIPDRHARQLAEVRKCSPDFVIAGTPFSTLTVNNNVAGAIHKDAGDYPDGFGVISCMRRGSYAGGLLGFPAYGVGADLEDRDVIFFDPHEWHGVTPLVHADPRVPGERITVVYYLRARIADCMGAEQERDRAQRLETV